MSRASPARSWVGWMCPPFISAVTVRWRTWQLLPSSSGSLLNTVHAYPRELQCLARSMGLTQALWVILPPWQMTTETEKAGTEGTGTGLRWDFQQTHTGAQAARRAQAWPAVQRKVSEDKETVCTMTLTKRSWGCFLSPAWLQRILFAAATALPWPHPARVGKQLLRISGKMEEGLGEEYR